MTKKITETNVDVETINPDEGTLLTISEAVKKGAADAKQDASSLSAVSKTLSKAVYSGCYYTAYGVTFGALTIAKLVSSGDSAVAHGFSDGAGAAVADMRNRTEKREEVTVEQSEELKPAT